MRKSVAKLLVFFVFFFLLSVSVYSRNEDRRGEEEDEGRGGGQKGEIFVLPRPKQVMKGEAGEFMAVRGMPFKGLQSPMHIGFIKMEPKSLFLPQYFDSNLIIFVRRGKAKIGWIDQEGLIETNLKIGDVYRIPAGSTFYIVNTDEGQILQMICSIDTSESLGFDPFQSFFIGGGTSPKSILSGFDEKTLTTAFNVSSFHLMDMLTRQQGGPVVFLNGTHEPRQLAAFMQLKHQNRVFDDEGQDEEEKESWLWRKLMNFVGGVDNDKESKSTDAYNLYDRKPDFENKYGSSRAITQDDYAPLGHSGTSGVGIYLVNLTAGAMLAPHVNPVATEYGIVLKGTGSIEVVFPNGSSAMNRVVNEGDVFWIPRYFPFCHIASRDGPFEFFGFTTSARENRPQFLAGTSSILQTMKGPELAMSFGVSQDEFNELINAQNESIILPSAAAAPPQETQPPARKETQEEEEGHGKRKKGDPEGQVIELWE